MTVEGRRCHPPPAVSFFTHFLKDLTMSINFFRHARALALTAGFVGMLGLAGCGKQDAQPAAPQAAAPQQRVYLVGVESAYAPFSSENEQKTVVGFDIDVMKALAQKIGIEVKFVPTPFESIFNSLAQGDLDLLISAITITDERKKTVAFSEPYFEATQTIAVPASDTRVTKMTDLKALKVGTQSGTSGDELVQQVLGQNNANIKRFESTPLALAELEGGGVDAVVADEPVVKNYIANNPNSKLRTVSDNTFPKEDYGVAVRKDDPELLAKVNKGLADLKADGTFAAISVKYFGK